jgi:hypothetical protein
MIRSGSIAWVRAAGRLTPLMATLCSILGGYFRFVFSKFFAFFGVHFSDRWIAERFLVRVFGL